MPIVCTPASPNFGLRVPPYVPCSELESEGHQTKCGVTRWTSWATRAISQRLLPANL